MKNIKRKNGKSKNAGFTLLETIVALVIFTGSAMALADLLNTNLHTLSRVHDVSSQLPALKNVIAQISAMNLQQEEDGQFEMNAYVVDWQARLLEPFRQSQIRQGDRGVHQVGLYQVDFQIKKESRLVGEYSMRLLGFETVRANEF